MPRPKAYALTDRAIRQLRADNRRLRNMAINLRKEMPKARGETWRPGHMVVELKGPLYDQGAAARAYPVQGAPGDRSRTTTRAIDVYGSYLYGATIPAGWQVRVERMHGAWEAVCPSQLLVVLSSELNFATGFATARIHEPYATDTGSGGAENTGSATFHDKRTQGATPGIDLRVYAWMMNAADDPFPAGTQGMAFLIRHQWFFIGACAVATAHNDGSAIFSQQPTWGNGFGSGFGTSWIVPGQGEWNPFGPVPAAPGDPRPLAPRPVAPRPPVIPPILPGGVLPRPGPVNMWARWGPWF